MVTFPVTTAITSLTALAIHQVQPQHQLTLKRLTLTTSTSSHPLWIPQAAIYTASQHSHPEHLCFSRCTLGTVKAPMPLIAPVKSRNKEGREKYSGAENIQAGTCREIVWGGKLSSSSQYLPPTNSPKAGASLPLPWQWLAMMPVGDTKDGGCRGAASSRRSKTCSTTLLGAVSLCRNGSWRKTLLLDGTGRQFIFAGNVSRSALQDMVFNQLLVLAIGQGW